MAELTSNGNGKASLGLALLVLGSITAIWSSLNTSPTGLMAFVAKNDDKVVEKVARDAMNISLVLIILLGIGIFLVYKKQGIVPAVFGVIIGLFLFGYYHWILMHGNRIKNGQPSRYFSQVK